MKVQLNEAQKTAVVSKNQRILCLAGAGTGKTRVLTHRIAYLDEQREGTSNMLALTFTRLAAKEMKERVIELIGESQGKKLFAGTFHGWCVSILKEFHYLLDRDKNFTIYGEEDRRSLIKSILDDFGYSYKPEEVMYAEVNEIDDDNLLRVIQEYKYRLRQNNAFDLDMLMYQTYCLLGGNPEINKELTKRYKYVFVDEFQDTDDLQFNIIKALNPENLFVVGDDYQCWDENCTVKTDNGVKIIKELSVGDNVLVSARRGLKYSPVTGKSRPQKGQVVEITTETGKKIEITDGHNCFATLPSFNKYHYVYLMYRYDKGFRIGVTSGGKTSKLSNRTRSEKPNRLWLLKQCKSIDEAHFWEDYWSLTNQIPTNPYFKNGRGIKVTQDHLDKIFEAFGVEGGFKLLKDKNYDFDHPHFIPQGTDRHSERKRNINLLLNDKYGIRVSYDSDGVRIRKSFKSYKEACLYAENLKDKYNADIIFEKYSNKERVTVYVIPASQLMVGMRIPTERDDGLGLEKIISITKKSGKRNVYHIEVAESGNLVANGIVTHNSIYAWRGANPQNIIDISNNPDYEVVRLERNYRSSVNIVEGANQVINNNKNRTDKKLITEKDGPTIKTFELDDEESEATKIGELIKKYRFTEYHWPAFAVLARTNKQVDYISNVLNEMDIPTFVVSNRNDVFRKYHIRLLLNWIESAINPDDETYLKRIINFPRQRLLDLQLETIELEAMENGMTLYETLKEYAAESDIEEFIELQQKTLELFYNGESLTSQFNVLVTQLLKLPSHYKNTGLDNRIEDIVRASEKIMRWVKVQEDLGEKTDIETFVHYLKTKDIQDRLAQENTNAVKLMTIHAAKGLEFPVVFVAGMNQGTFPSKMTENIEEERRLFYVAVTRAKERLILTRPQKKRIWGDVVKEQPPSQFLSEII